MAEPHTVQAKVLSLGDITQYQYTNPKTGNAEIGTKFELECAVDNTSVTYEAYGFNRPKLAIGSTYTFTIRPADGNYSDRIIKVDPAGIVTQPQAPSGVGSQLPPQAPKAAPTAPKQVAQQTPLKPDLKTRFVQYGWDVKNSQESATARVGHLVQLLLAGKLANAKGELYTDVTEAMYDNWVIHFVDLYWKEVLDSGRVPEDAWGDLVEDQNPPAVEEPNA
jgi:hypothetical protein